MVPAATLLSVALAASAKVPDSYRISFDGRTSNHAREKVKSAFTAAETEWKAYTGLTLKFRQPMQVHVVTERNHVPGAKGAAVKKSCAWAAHLFVLPEEKGVPGSDTPPQGPGSVESLEREFVRTAMEALRKDPLPAWLEMSAVLAASENPQSTFLDPSGFRQLYERGHVGRGAALSPGPAKLANCIPWQVANPWTVLMLRYVHDAKGPEAVARVLGKAWKAEDVAALAEGIPLGSAMANVEKFDEGFDAWIRAKYGILAADGGSK
jgi:hypothetical protein